MGNDGRGYKMRFKLEPCKGLFKYDIKPVGVGGSGKMWGSVRRGGVMEK